MPEEERNIILGPKKTVNKLPAKQMNRLETTSSSEMKAGESKPESSKKQGKRKEDAENDEVFISFICLEVFADSSQQADASVDPKKVQDPEKNTKVLRVLTTYMNAASSFGRTKNGKKKSRHGWKRSARRKMHKINHSLLCPIFSPNPSHD